MADVKDKLVSLEGLKVVTDGINDMTTGINLLRGTRDFKIGLTQNSKYGSARIDGFYSSQLDSNVTFYKEADGFSVVNIKHEPSSSYSWINIIPSIVANAKTGDEFTASFEFMIDDISSFQMTNLNLFAINTINGSTTTNTTIDLASFGYNLKNLKSKQWYKAVIPFTIKTPIDDDGMFYAVLQIGMGGSINFKKVKIERGTINNPVWSPSPFDTNYINDETTGINLLRGTRDFVLGIDKIGTTPYCYDGFYVDSMAPYRSLYKDDEGYTVLKLAQTGLSADRSVWFSSSGISGLEPNEILTISFEFMVDDVSNYDGPISPCSIQDRKITNEIVSNTTKSLSSLGLSGNLKSGEWYKARTTYTVSSSYNTLEQVIILYLNLYRNGSINFRKIKVERGNINNPIWSPSPFDIDYINDETTGINLLRGTRDFSVGTRLFKNTSGPWTTYSDGFKFGESWVRTVDDDGYGVVTAAKYVDNVNSKSYLNSSPLIERMNAGEDVTLSFEYFVSDKNTAKNGLILLYFNYINGEGTQTKAVSYSVSQIFGNIDNLKESTWTKACVKHTLLYDVGVETFLHVLFVITNPSNSDGGFNGISVKKVKLERGAINNPIWSASPFDFDDIDDATTGINLLRGTRDFSEGTTKSSNTGTYLDGFIEQPGQNVLQIDKIKDKDGFTECQLTFIDAGKTYGILNCSIIPEFKAYETFTISFDIKITSSDFSYDDYFLNVGVYDTKSVKQNILDTKTSVLKNEGLVLGEWHRFVTTFTTKDKSSEDSSVLLVKLQVPKTAKLGDTFSYKKVKVERGVINNPVWSASPFDVAQENDVKPIVDGIPFFSGIVPTEYKITENGVDLNTLVKPGTYVCNGDAIANSCVHLPSDYAKGSFKMFVVDKRPDSTVDYTIDQILLPYNSGEIYRRNNSNTGWYSWVRLTGTSGIVPIDAGGTSATTAKAAQYNLLNDMNEYANDAADSSMFVMKSTSPNTGAGAIGYRTAPYVWNWIASKIRSVFGFNSSNYLPASRVTGLPSVPKISVENVTFNNHDIIKVGQSIPLTKEFSSYKGGAPIGAYLVENPSNRLMISSLSSSATTNGIRVTINVVDIRTDSDLGSIGQSTPIGIDIVILTTS